jgi:hypothetical protein
MKAVASEVTETAKNHGAASLVLALTLLHDSDDLTFVREKIRQHARECWLNDTETRGLPFAQSVREEQRRLLFEELGSNVNQQAYIDSCLPESEQNNGN